MTVDFAAKSRRRNYFSMKLYSVFTCITLAWSLLKNYKTLVNYKITVLLKIRQFLLLKMSYQSDVNKLLFTFWILWCFNLIKGATKLYVTHYLSVAIILFNTVLYKFAFSTYSFGKPFFTFLILFCKLKLKCKLHTLSSICIISVYIVGIRNSLCFFCRLLETTCKNRYASQNLSCVYTHLYING